MWLFSQVAISEQYLIPKAQRDHGMDKVQITHDYISLAQPPPPLLLRCFEMFVVGEGSLAQFWFLTRASVLYVVMVIRPVFDPCHRILLLTSLRLLWRVTFCVLFQEDRLGHVEITSEAIETLARWYAREAGVRNLAKLVDKVGACSKRALLIVS